MNKRIKALVVAIMVIAAALTFCVQPAGAGDDRAAQIAQPNSSAFGRTLSEWLLLYWERYLGEPPVDPWVGHVLLMPLPAGECISGCDSWTVEDPAIWKGSLDISVPPGTPFVLPLAMLYGEIYNNGSPADDPANYVGTFQTGVHPLLTIDGRTIVTDANKMSFYIPPTYFDPAVFYPQPTDYGSIAAIWLEGIGVVSQPLAVGRHVIKLYEPYTLFVGGVPAYSMVYDNTWIVTVTPR